MCLIWSVAHASLSSSLYQSQTRGLLRLAAPESLAAAGPARRLNSGSV